MLAIRWIRQGRKDIFNFIVIIKYYVSLSFQDTFKRQVRCYFSFIVQMENTRDSENAPGSPEKKTKNQKIEDDEVGSSCYHSSCLCHRNVMPLATGYIL